MKTNQVSISKQHMQSLMALAATLQRQYDILGAPTTQNIRNPYPMHKLIVGVLPTHKLEGITAETIKAKIEEWGYRVNNSTLCAVISQMEKSGRICSIRYNNAPYKHYYFSMK